MTMTESIRISKTAYQIIDILQLNGPQLLRDLVEMSGLSVRALRYALRRLIDLQIIKKIPNLQDMRSSYYDLYY